MPHSSPGDFVDWIVALLLLVGALLSVAAGVGLLRFPDALSRMHAATKPQILGLISVLAAVALEEGNWKTLLIIIPTVILQMITSPMSAHMIGRAGYRTGNYRRDLIYRDELEDDIERAAQRADD